MTDRHPIWELLDKLQMDNRAQAAKLVELRALMCDVQIPEPVQFTCPDCGIRFCRVSLMEEHRYSAHEGPVPGHYLSAERLAGMTA